MMRDELKKKIEENLDYKKYGLPTNILTRI